MKARWLPRSCRGGEVRQGAQTVELLTRIFGRENVYVELQRHQEREEEWRNQAAIRIARSLNLPVLATNGVRYATAHDREILDLFTAVRHHLELDQAGRLLALNSRRHLRTRTRDGNPLSRRSRRDGKHGRTLLPPQI